MVAEQDTPRRGFTPKFIESLKPSAKVRELADPATSGLVLRVHPTGIKSFRWYVRSLNRVVTIGPWTLSEAPSHVTLKEAREWLERLKAARAGGLGELERVMAGLERHLAPRPAPVPATESDTVRAVSVTFLALLDKQRKRPDVARTVVEKDILPVIGHMPLRALKKSDCRAVVDRVVARGATTHAGKVLGLLKQLLDYAENVEDDFVNPAARLKAANLGVESNVRDRWLTDKEIPALWRVLSMDEATREASAFSVPERRTRIALRLLLLTAARSGELRLAKWADVDLEAATWTIPVTSQKLTPKQAKQAKPFAVPLPPTALALFKELRNLGGSEWVLSSGLSDAGCYTDKALGRAMNRLWHQHPALKELPAATPHDLRRTARTWLGKLGIAPHICERCLNHSVGRIAKTYDHGDYLDERRTALEKWDAFIARLVSPKASKVAFLPAAGAR